MGFVDLFCKQATQLRQNGVDGTGACMENRSSISIEVSGQIPLHFFAMLSRYPSKPGGCTVNLTLTAALLEKMTDGVILLSSNGSVTGHNPAARPWLPHCHDGVVALGRLIRQIERGTAQVPLRIDCLFAKSLATAEFHLLQNGALGFAILIAPCAADTLANSIPMPGPCQRGCASRLYAEQAELYARDLAFLLPRRPTGAGVSDEEHACLARISTIHRSEDSH